MALPVCSVTYSKHKCAALRRTAGAWESLTGFATDNVKIKTVKVTAVRAKKGRAPRKQVTTTAKFTRGTAWTAKLTGITTGSWTFTARAVDSSGNARTTKPDRVSINYGLSPFQKLPAQEEVAGEVARPASVRPADATAVGLGVGRPTNCVSPVTTNPATCVVLVCSVRVTSSSIRRRTRGIRATRTSASQNRLIDIASPATRIGGQSM